MPFVFCRGMLLRTFPFEGFEVSIYNSIKEIADGWDHFVPGHLHADYLTLLEDARPGDLEFRYIVVKDENHNSCALIYLQKLRFRGININYSKSIGLSWLLKLVLELGSFNILICGNLFAVDYPATWFESNRMNWDFMIRLLKELFRKEKASAFILKDLDKSLTADRMQPHGLLSYPTDLTMNMHIHPSWSDMDDYVNSLSKKYRKRAMKILEAGGEIERRKLNAGEIRSNLERIERLFRQVASKQTIRMGLIDAQYFELYSMRFKEKFSMEGYFYRDKLIAFASYIDRIDTLEMHYIGIDYAFNTSHKIYLNMLFDGVRHAIQKQKRELELGRTAREAKANLGAHPVYFNDYILVRSRLSRMLVGLITGYFQKQMGSGWMERHPFGKSNEEKK